MIAPWMIQIANATSIDEALARATESLKERGVVVERAAVDGARAWLREQDRRLLMPSAARG